jgi:hypothetical protein
MELRASLLSLVATSKTELSHLTVRGTLVRQSISQTLCRNIDIEIRGNFTPLITHLFASHDVIGMAVLMAQALLCHLHIAEAKKGIFLMNIYDNESVLF